MNHKDTVELEEVEVQVHQLVQKQYDLLYYYQVVHNYKDFLEVNRQCHEDKQLLMDAIIKNNIYHILSPIL